MKGLDAGADDYITKPYHPKELRFRLDVGALLIELQEKLLQAERIAYSLRPRQVQRTKSTNP